MWGTAARNADDVHPECTRAYSHRNTDLPHADDDERRSLEFAHLDRGAKAVWIEMGGAGAHEEEWAARIATGLRRALGKTGVLAEAAMQEADVTLLTGAATSFRASHPGLYLPELRESAVGTVVPAQTLIGSLIDAVTGNVVETYRAPYERTAMLLLRPRIGVLEGGEIVGVVATID